MFVFINLLDYYEQKIDLYLFIKTDVIVYF